MDSTRLWMETRHLPRDLPRDVQITRKAQQKETLTKMSKGQNVNGLFRRAGDSASLVR